MEMKWIASHMNVKGQGHFRAVSPCNSVMAIHISFVLNNFSATSLVQVSGERLQDQWSSGRFICIFATRGIVRTGYNWGWYKSSSFSFVCFFVFFLNYHFFI